MVANDRNDRIRKIDRRKDVCTNTRMQLHLFELLGGELSRLVQNVLRYGQLSHVMQ
jgi:hypothetical protein